MVDICLLMNIYGSLGGAALGTKNFRGGLVSLAARDSGRY